MFRHPKHSPPVLLLSLVGGISLLPAEWAPGRSPRPANDEEGAAQVLGPELPILVLGSTIGARNSLSAVPPSSDLSADGPDVFYRFTPPATATYRVQLLPWQHVPLRSLDRRFVLSVRDPAGIALAGARAADDARPLHVDARLEADQTYLIGVDHPAGAHDAFEFTLVVDLPPADVPDGCATAYALSDRLPAAALADLGGAAPDFTYSQREGRCAVAGEKPTTALGGDHVYRFVPPDDGDYAIELATSGDTGFDAVLYVDDACPPSFDDGCRGASDHTPSTVEGGRHELIVVSLEAQKEYWIYVDSADGPPEGQAGAYALIVDRAEAYEISEIEPNDAPATATPADRPMSGGQLVGPMDEDWWALPGSRGDRVYAWVNNGGALNGALDTDLAFFAPGGALIELDTEDADGADADAADLRFVYSTTAAVIAGARMTTDAPHYLRITDGGPVAARSTVHRYRLHAGVEPAGRAPLRECEPNNTPVSADQSGKLYYAGAVETDGDIDMFNFYAEAGDRVFIALDGDPERDSTGTGPALNDPRGLAGKLTVRDPDGDLLIRDISDPNSAQSPPDYPAQAGFFVARTSGVYSVEVAAQEGEEFGPEATYELAVFLNNAAPSLPEDRDPVLTLAHDTDHDTIAVDASDAAEGDSGICDVELVAAENVTTSGLDFAAGAGAVSFAIELVDAGSNGAGKLRVTDCAGNTACQPFFIDAHDPVCEALIAGRRILQSSHAPMHVPDHQPSGPGIDDTLMMNESGVIGDVDVSVTLESASIADLDVSLISPGGTSVKLFAHRGGPAAFSITDAVFDDSATAPLSSDRAEEPFTGRWRPDDVRGLAAFSGQDARGLWRLNVRDDSSVEDGGARLVRWSLDIEAEFSGPQRFAGRALDAAGPDAGIRSIELAGGENLELRLPDDFAPGVHDVDYSATLIDSSTNGWGTVIVTDLSGNSCESAVRLQAQPDVTPPTNRGLLTRDLTITQEVQAHVPAASPTGVISRITAPRIAALSEIEVGLTLDTRDVGRLAAALSHSGAQAVLLNRVGMDERGGAGLSKNSMDVVFDDDAPATSDAHLEPAAPSVAFRGVRQPDGRGDFLGDGITSDSRDQMLFRLLPSNAPPSELEGKGGRLPSAGGAGAGGESWDLFVADFGKTETTRTVLRRWSLTLKSSCGPQRYLGTAADPDPGSGVCSIALAGENLRLRFKSGFAPGDDSAEYIVELADPMLPGNGAVHILDCDSNALEVPIRLAPAASDAQPPSIEGEVHVDSHRFEGHAVDHRPDDRGVLSVELAPHADNLEIVSMTPPLRRPVGGESAAVGAAANAGVSEVGFEVGLKNPGLNGRGYVRVTDACGLRSHVLVDIDAQAPVCAGSVSASRRYESGGDLPAAIPDNDPAGVASSIVVRDPDLITDLDVGFDIDHPRVEDLDLTLINPLLVGLISDRGDTGGDFVGVTLDDEAASELPVGAAGAPFTGAWRPEDGKLSALDGRPARATYTLRVVDDKPRDVGTLARWWVTLTSPTFSLRYDGRAEDAEDYASGICAIALEGAANLKLSADRFTPGDRSVHYQVSLTEPGLSGVGKVLVVDCAGNSREVPILLSGAFADCNTNGQPDDLELAQGTAADCNRSQIPDECDLAAGTSLDANTNGTPDECETRIEGSGPIPAGRGTRSAQNVREYGTDNQPERGLTPSALSRATAIELSGLLRKVEGVRSLCRG